jgi:cytosine/adenosine deaminase-related metal-dependent hydrolase
MQGREEPTQILMLTWLTTFCALLAVNYVAHAATLLKGGTFITYNDDTSDLEIIVDGAMLFNDTILSISNASDGLDSHLTSDPSIKVVNTTGRIISPGFVDTHRHTW